MPQNQETYVAFIDLKKGFDKVWSSATQLTFTFSNSTIETVGKGIEYVQSSQ